MRSAARALQRRPRLVKALQLALLVAILALCIWAVRTEWSHAWPLLEHARIGYVVLAFITVCVYYLVFVLGWDAHSRRLGNLWVPYRVALQAEGKDRRRRA